MKGIFRKFLSVFFAIALMLNLFPEKIHALSNNAITLSPSGVDDTVTINEALAQYDEVYLKGGEEYIINDSLAIEGSKKLDSVNGRATIIQTSEVPALRASARVKMQVTVSQNLDKGSDEIILSTDGEIASEDIILIKSDKLWHIEPRGTLTKGEVHKVDTVYEDRIILAEGAFDSYSEDEQLTLTVFENATLEINNINFKHNTPLNTTMITVKGYNSPVIRATSVINSKNLGLQLVNNYGARVSFFESSLSSDVNTKVGYGIQEYGGTYTTIEHSKMEKCRRGVDVSGNNPSYFCRVVSNIATGDDKSLLATTSSGFGSHSTAVNTTFLNNKINGGFQYGFVNRGMNQTYEGNTCSGNQEAFLYAAYGDEVMVQNNLRLGDTKMKYFVKVNTTIKDKDYGRVFDGKVYIFYNKAENITSWFNTNIDGNLRTNQNERL